MTIVSFTYANGHTRQINIVSTAAGDAENTAILTTENEGDIAVSLADTPEIWEQILPLLPAP